MILTAAQHNATVTGLLVSAMGDLMLCKAGHLWTRNVWAENPMREVPFEQHTKGQKLATIGRSVDGRGYGWTLTEAGADFILENCPPDSAREIKRLARFSEECARARRAAAQAAEVTA